MIYLFNFLAVLIVIGLIFIGLYLLISLLVFIYMIIRKIIKENNTKSNIPIIWYDEFAFTSYNREVGVKVYKIINIVKTKNRNKIINRYEYLLVCRDLDINNKINKEIVVFINYFYYIKLKNSKDNKILLSENDNGTFSIKKGSV